MSLSQIIAGAAAEAQGVLAELGGAAPGRTNSLYNGQKYLAVYGQPQTERIMMPSGGWRQRTFLSLTVTRDQFDVPPVAEKQWIRTDCTPQLAYTIRRVGTHDSFLYHLDLFRPGEPVT